MKRTIVASVMFLIIISVSITGQLFVENVTDEVNLKIEECENLYNNGNIEKAITLSEEAELHWRNKSSLLSIFINHDAIEKIGLSIAKLSPYAKTNSSDNFLSECAITRMMLKNQSDELHIGIESVF